MRKKKWEGGEPSALQQAKAEIKQLRAELKQRVVERTRELATANTALRQELAEHRRAQDALRRQQEILQKIFGHLPVMVSFMDKDARIELVNRTWERTLRASQRPSNPLSTPGT